MYATETLHPGLFHSGEYSEIGPMKHSPIWYYARMLVDCDELWEIKRYPRREKGYANRWAWWAAPCARRSPGEETWEKIHVKDPEEGIYGTSLDEVIAVIETAP